MSVYKRFALIFACFVYIGLPLCFLALCALLWLYDPFMFFHKPYFREQTYHSDMRIQARGIIDFTDFDSVILGSSMLENTSAKEAGEKLGDKWVNLSLSGSDFSERKIVLDYTLSRKKIRQIIFSVDAYVLLNGDRENSNSWRAGEKLYTQGNFWYRLNKYLDKKIIKCATKWSKNAECIGDKNDLESVTQTIRAEQKYFGGFKHWTQWQKDKTLKVYKGYLQNNHHPKSDENKRLNFKEKQEYLQATLFKMIKENPNIQFHFIYPPYSRVLYALFPFDKIYHKGRNGKEIFDEIKEILPYVVRETAKFDNAQIYGFDELFYVDEIKNYFDSIHYWLDMNSMQLDAIANGTHILTPENIDEYLQTMENKIKAYDLAPLIREIKEWEKTQNDKK